MSKIKYVLLIFVLAFHAVSAENFSTDKKNIKDILLEISEKIGTITNQNNYKGEDL